MKFVVVKLIVSKNRLNLYGNKVFGKGYEVRSLFVFFYIGYLWKCFYLFSKLNSENL